MGEPPVSSPAKSSSMTHLPGGFVMSSHLLSFIASNRRVTTSRNLRFLLTAAVLALPFAVLGDTKTVGPVGDYPTIQAAVNALPNPGARTVNVQAGTYNEAVLVSNRNT